MQIGSKQVLCDGILDKETFAGSSDKAPWEAGVESCRGRWMDLWGGEKEDLLFLSDTIGGDTIHADQPASVSLR